MSKKSAPQITGPTIYHMIVGPDLLEYWVPKGQLTKPARNQWVYHPIYSDRVCNLLSQNMTLEEIADGFGLPPMKTLKEWIKVHFPEEYAEAKDAQADRAADRLIRLTKNLKNAHKDQVPALKLEALRKLLA